MRSEEEDGWILVGRRGQPRRPQRPLYVCDWKPYWREDRYFNAPVRGHPHYYDSNHKMWSGDCISLNSEQTDDFLVG